MVNVRAHHAIFLVGAPTDHYSLWPICQSRYDVRATTYAQLWFYRMTVIVSPLIVASALCPMRMP